MCQQFSVSHLIVFSIEKLGNVVWINIAGLLFLILAVNQGVP